jgi:zinc-ribbon domain
VAQFCTKCGVALSPDKNFCPSCGAAVPAAGVTPAVPASSGASAAKIVLILVGVVVGLGLLMMMVFAFGAWRISRAVRVSRGADGVTLSAPGATVTTGGASTTSDADLGVPAYPGSSRRAGGVQIHTLKGSMLTETFTTPDPPSQVIAFYKSQLGESASVIETGRGAILTSGGHDKESVMVTVTAESSAKNGATRIAIVHAKNNRP